MVYVKSSISRLIMMLTVAGLCASPLFAFGGPGAADVNAVCLSQNQVCSVDSSEAVVATAVKGEVHVKACCSKHALQAAQPEGTTHEGSSKDSTPQPCGDSSHCACCISAGTGIVLAPIAPLKNTLPATHVDLPFPSPERTILADRVSPLLRPPIG